MNRDIILKSQPRSYIEGTISLMNNEWIFFDDEDDEAYLLSELTTDSLDIYIADNWEIATMINNQQIFLNYYHTYVADSAKVRIQKVLQLSYEQFLDELTNTSFQKFIDTLKELEYSIYDCMLCHNFLSFIPSSPCSGVNFLLFDNNDLLCSIHHHFIRNNHLIYDKFEFTRADGVQIEIK